MSWYDDDDDYECWQCGGDGYVSGDELSDPLWYDDDETYICPCCGGSGLAKDCTYM